MVNYLAVLVAAIVGMVVGFIWYSPKVFGKMWMKLSGVNPKDKPVPERPCVHWIGHSPVATRDWMGWFLMERANHIYQNGDAADREMVWETFRYMGYAGPT